MQLLIDTTQLLDQKNYAVTLRYLLGLSEEMVISLPSRLQWGAYLLKAIDILFYYSDRYYLMTYV